MKYAEELSEVRLCKDLIAWKRVPTSIRVALQKGLARIQRVRSAIASSSKVNVMPPVRAFAEVWVAPGNSGAAWAKAHMFDVRGDQCPGVMVSAPVVCCEDETEVRRVLVHEFGHCFDMVTRIVDHIDRGQTGELCLGDSYHPFSDEEHEESHLPKPADWFSDEDAGRFARWDDPRMGEVMEACLLGLKLHQHLPVVTPNPSFVATRCRLPVDVMKRARALRAALP